ncbi:MAG: acyl carrier protein [Ruminococcus sp.]|nr:acyl carrier protein [Ruminococcus sp.]
MVNEKLVEILKTFSKNSEQEITPDTSLSLDLGITSFDLMQIVYAIEQAFSVRLTPELVKDIKLVRDVEDFIFHADEKGGKI